MVYLFLFMAYGLWFMVYSLWFIVHGLLFIVLCQAPLILLSARGFSPRRRPPPPPPPHPRAHHQPRRRANGFICCRRSGYATPNFTTKFSFSHSQPGGAVVSNVKWIGRLNSNPLKLSTNPYQTPSVSGTLSQTLNPFCFRGLSEAFLPGSMSDTTIAAFSCKPAGNIFTQGASCCASRAHHRNTSSPSSPSSSSSPSSTSQHTRAAQTCSPQAGPARLQ